MTTSSLYASERLVRGTTHDSSISCQMTRMPNTGNGAGAHRASCFALVRRSHPPASHSRAWLPLSWPLSVSGYALIRLSLIGSSFSGYLVVRLAITDPDFLANPSTMAATMDHDYYDGFRTFDWLADIVGLPIDQVRWPGRRDVGINTYRARRKEK